MLFRSVVVEAGYIAVELAVILNALGCETHNLIRKDHVLRNFDESLSYMLTDEMVNAGVNLHRNTQVRNLCICYNFFIDLFDILWEYIL